MFNRHDATIFKHVESLSEALPPMKKKKAGKRSKQSATSGTMAPILRGTAQMKCATHESAVPLSTTPPVMIQDSQTEWMEGPKIKVVLISEGLGNRRDMNYYGPEAIDSGPFVFEGAQCYLNHPSYTEERDIPERRVQDLAGYFKNVQVESMDGVRCVTGELHFDLSDTGRMGYNKMLTALHYQAEFPNSDKEYVGLSVNANGESEPRQMIIDGEESEVNYVKKFTDSRSTDIVTLPARGGKALALVESAAGAGMKNKEVRTMIVKRLQAAQTSLKEAIAKATDEEQKKSLHESLTNVESLLKDSLDAANRSKESDGEMESEGESETESEGEGDSEDGVAPGHKVKKTTTTVVHHTADGDDEEDDSESEESEKYEANRLAVKHLISESKLESELFDVEELSRKGLKEAKAEIRRMRRVSESFQRKAMKVLGDVSPAHAAKLSESGKSGKGDSTSLFAGCSL